MGNAIPRLRSNRVRSARSKTSDSETEATGLDRFPSDHEVRVPVDYPSKGRKHKSISLKSIGSFRIRKNKGTSIRKTTSLQSAVAVRLDPEAEKIRKDFEQFRAEKTSEIDLLSRQCEVTMSENRRLRGELKMLQTTCSKLRHEIDKALITEQDAVERASAIEAERDKIQRQFKLFRDTKANELQTLLKEKRVLETRLTKYVNLHGTESDSNPSGQELYGEGGEILGHLNDMGNIAGTLDAESTADVSNHFAFKGVEHSHFGSDSQEPYTNIKKGDWDSVVQNLVKSLNATIMSIPENNVYRIFITGSEEMEEHINCLIKEYCPPLVQQCEFEGRFLLFIYIPVENWALESEKDFDGSVLKRTQLVEDSDIFICFLGRTINSITKQDIQVGIERKPGIKHSIFCIDGNEEENVARMLLSDEILQTMNSSSRTKVCYFNDATEQAEIVGNVFKSMETIIQRFLSEQPDHNSASKIFPTEDEDWCVGCGWDAFGDFEQQQALSYHSSEETNALGHQQYFDQLNEHVNYDGPVQPLLVTGENGSGKSFLLARWIQSQLAEATDSCVLYHFVGEPTTFSADIIQIMRRLAVKLMQQLPSTCNPTRLETDFPKYLERAMSRLPNGIIIVIDNADNLQGLNTYMKWVVDPLPVGCRVVVSVGSDSYPKDWRSWPKLNVKPLNKHETSEYLHNSWMNEHISLSSDLVENVQSNFGNAALENPLYLTILNRRLACCKSYQEISTEMAKFQKFATLSDLYLVLIEDLENDYGVTMIKNVLTHIYFSRNGLTESEIMQLFNIPWLTWVEMLKEFSDRVFVTSYNGFLSFANSQVISAVEKYYNIPKDESTVSNVRENLIQFFQTKNVPGQVTYRVADELPWLLLKTGQLKVLKDVINTMCIFVRLYRKGRCAELIGYWKYINYDVTKMANCYYDFIKMMENHPNFGPRAPILYDTLGRFLREIGLLSQALRPLERSLELRESSMDPDDPSIGQSFHHLGGLYTQWKKFGTAETMFKQALEIKENAYGPDHPSVAKELEALAMLYHHQEKTSMAEPLRNRAMQILQTSYRKDSANSSMAVLKRCADEIFSIAKTNVSTDIAKSLNDLGVLFFIQNDNTSAKSFFTRALEMRELLLGSDHPDVAQSLHNLAALYNDQKLFKQAETLYEKALAIRRNIFPPDNPSVQSTVRHLAGLYRKQSKYKEAERLYKEILETREKSLGENHPGVATAVNNLAVLMCQMNKHQEALPLFERAIKLYEEHLGIQHARVSEILQNMAKLYLDTGETQEAARLFKHALDQNRTAYMPPSRLPRSGSRLREHEVDSKQKDITSRRSSFSSIARVQNR